MKFSIITTKVKTSSIILWSILCGVIITPFIYYPTQGSDFFNELLDDGLWVLIIFLIFLVLYALIGLFIIVLSCAYVKINEKEIAFCLGKIVINQSTWEQVVQIKLVEFVLRGKRTLYINTILKDNQDTVKTNNTRFSIFDKSRISLKYNKTAFELIKQYYPEHIYEVYLALEYDDNGKHL